MHWLFQKKCVYIIPRKIQDKEQVKEEKANGQQGVQSLTALHV